MKPGSTSSLQGQIGCQLSSRWKPSKVTKDANINRQGFGHRILRCARYFVLRLPWERKNHQWRILYSIIGAFEGINRQKNNHKLRRKKCSFNKMQNYMKYTSNCFCIHPILQIWPPATTGCLQTSKECSRERDLAPMKKWYWKLRRILRPKTNRSTKKVSNC